MNGRELGFLKTSTILPDGGFRPVARFVCNGCGATSEFSLKSREGVNPEAMAKLVRGRGWVADPFRRSASYCPACLVRPKNDPNSELKRVNLMPKIPEPSSATREATPQQRTTIRNYLDKHFDDAAGAHLDGMSDQKIADAVNIPRVIVERMRDAAYGPIKVDPEVQAIRAELAALKVQAETLTAAVAGLTARVSGKKS
jgi:hypothetical protein